MLVRSSFERDFMLRALTHRLLTAAAAVVFATTSGVTGMQAHPLSMHGPHASEVMAPGAATPTHHGHSAAHGGEHGEEHEAPEGAAHHSSHSDHGSGTECTCIGPCQGGGTPSLPDPRSHAVGELAVQHAAIPPMAALAVREHPSPYLRPLPNAPPERG
jgi:hypothetical protein